MRILHVEVGGGYGGSVRGLELYLRHSRRKEFEHDVVFYYPTPASERLAGVARRVWSLTPGHPPVPHRPGAAVADLEASRVAAAVDEVQDWTNLARALPMLSRLRPVIGGGQYDVVHVNNTWTYQAPTLLAAAMARRPVVAHARNPVRRGPLARGLLRLVAHVVADSDSFRQALAGWRAPVHIDTCYNCVELGAPDVAATATWRQRLLPADGVLIGSVGRLDDQKGYEHLVRAARRVVDAHPRVRFAIAGDGPRRAFLADLVAAQGLADRFFLCGFQADVTNFIAALDLFVSSSRWEGLPLALVEAMLLGKRVVATDVGGNREVVEPGRTGLLVAPGDPQALAAGLLEALDPGTPPLDGDAIRRTGRAFADPVANAEAFDAVLDQVVRSYGSGRLARTRLWRPIQRQGTEWPQRASSPEIQALSRPSPGAEGP